jgi:ABC-type dipeptide/oligopeptide/nickel transport system ATPase component
MVGAYVKRTSQREDYRIITFVAESGSGKSRLGQEISQILVQNGIEDKYDIKVDHRRPIWIDFNGGGGAITERDVATSTTVAMGLRIAAKGLFNITTTELRALLKPEDELLFSCANVLPLLARQRRAAMEGIGNTSLLLPVHIDEFHLAIDDLRL